MAPLKFRAWHNGKMYDSFRYENICGKSFVGGSLEGGIDISYGVDGKNTVVMQFTGFLDKNGKEIFEGDILRALAPRGPFDSDRYEGEVIYANNMAMWEFKAINPPLDVCPLKFASDAEIIGNVFEYPNS